MPPSKQKIVLFGPANSGKTSLQKFFWEKKSYEQLRDLSPTKSYEYSDEPLKFGALKVSCLDLGGQTNLIDQWLDNDASFRCFELAKAVIFVVDFSDELLGRGNFLKKMEYTQQLLRLLISSLRVQVLPYQDVDLLVFVHKWDRVVERRRNEMLLRDLIKSGMKQIELEENFENVLTERARNPKFASSLPHDIQFHGFFFTSIKDLRFSPRRYIKKILPKTDQFRGTCEYFKERLTEMSEFFSLSLIDLNFFDIDFVQYPDAHDFAELKEFTLRTIMHCFDIDSVSYMIIRHEDGIGPLYIFLMRINPDIYCLLVGKLPNKDQTVDLLLEFKDQIHAIDLVYE